MKLLRMLEKGTERLTRYSAYIAAVALIFNTVIIAAYIISRALGHAIIGTEEYVCMGQVILIALALGYTHHSRGLVYVGFFMKKLPGKCPWIAWVLDAWISVAVCAAWAYQSFVRLPVVRQTSNMLTIPFKPFFLIMSIGIVIYTLSQLFEAIKCTVGCFRREVREEVIEDWPS